MEEMDELEKELKVAYFGIPVRVELPASLWLTIYGRILRSRRDPDLPTSEKVWLSSFLGKVEKDLAKIDVVTERGFELIRQGADREETESQERRANTIRELQEEVQFLKSEGRRTVEELVRVRETLKRVFSVHACGDPGCQPCRSAEHDVGMPLVPPGPAPLVPSEPDLAERPAITREEISRAAAEAERMADADLLDEVVPDIPGPEDIPDAGIAK